MSGYTLTWRGQTDVMLADGAALLPCRLAGLSHHDLAAVPMQLGRATKKLGELFDIQGEPGDTLTLANLPALPRFGAGMTRGTLIIQGDAGDETGASMQGGILIIHGPAGAHLGMRQRRGLILVRGPVGPSPGYRMLAGTIIIQQGDLDHPGLAMRRGTIISLDQAAKVTCHESFALDGRFPLEQMTVLQLIRQSLDRRGWLSAAAWAGEYLLHRGDRFELVKGELWQKVS